ncbi:MAG: hypothetical protein Q8M29_07265 [Bacteroidota bacterium]|nr:hypothetical protein [Bacteroidota bacterium]
MSDLANTTILAVTNNCCDIKILQYIYHVDMVMNDRLKEDELARNATLLAFLEDLGIYYARFKQLHIPLVIYGEAPDRKILPAAAYNLKRTEELIAKAEILEWETIPPDLTNETVKEEYNERIKKYSSDEAIYLLSETYFIARVYFKDPENLKGYEPGMNYSTTLDTWICDWL